METDPLHLIGNYNGKYFHDVPDYANDLNAMHEVEKILTDGQMAMYMSILRGNVDHFKYMVYILVKCA